MQQFTYLRPEGQIGKAGAEDASTIADRYNAALIVEDVTFEDIGVTRAMEWGNLGGREPNVDDVCDIIVKDATGYRRVSGGRVMGRVGRENGNDLVVLEKDGHRYWAPRLGTLFLVS
jgi:hypothetical protein